MATDGQRDHARIAAPVIFADYSTYPEAQAAVDRLLADGVPPERVSIVWSRLRQVEPVSGGRGEARVALAGALGGGAAGGLAAILLNLFVPLANGMSAVPMLLTWTLSFAALGAFWQVVSQRFRGPGLDRSPDVELAAESYQVWVDEDVLPGARAGTQAAAPAEAAAPAGGDGVVHATATSLLASPPPAAVEGGPGARPRRTAPPPRPLRSPDRGGSSAVRAVDS